MPKENILLPSELRLPKTHPYYKEIIELHRQACTNDEAFYLDPQSGYVVFTANYLLQKGICCGSLCRHCPFTEDS